MPSPRRRFLALVAIVAMSAVACGSSATPAPVSPAPATASPAASMTGTGGPASPGGTGGVTAGPTGLAGQGEPGAVLQLPNSVITTPWSPDAVTASAFGATGWELIRGAGTTLGGQVTVRDLQAGTTRSAAGIAPGRAVAQLVAGDDRVAWVEAWRDDPAPAAGTAGACPDAGKPLRWRIVVYKVATRTQTTIAGGTSTRLVYGGPCADIQPPVLAVDGGRLAYSVEAGTAADPLAQRVIVQEAVPGAAAVTYQTAGVVEELRLSGEAVAWRENAEAAAGSLVPGRGRLVLIKAGGAAPVLVEVHAGGIGMAGRRLAWVAAGSTPAAVWTMRIDTGEGFAIPLPLHSALTATDVAFVAAGEEIVAWGQRATTPDGCCAPLLALWAAGEPVARTVEGLGGPTGAWIGNGWLAWATRHTKPAWHDDPSRPDGFHAIRLDAIAPPWP